MSTCETICSEQDHRTTEEETNQRKRKLSENTNSTNHSDVDENTTKEETKPLSPMEQIKAQRREMEQFLLNDGNKINKMAIRSVMAKWGDMESILYDLVIENEKLKAINSEVKSTPSTYAQTTASGKNISYATIKTRTETPTYPPKNRSEVVLIKPTKETDKRSNEVLKKSFTSKLKNLRSKLRVKQIPQMRNKGIIVEVESKEDADLIMKTSLQKANLKVEDPKKLNPSIVIYDAEKEHTSEKLKKDFICMNFPGKKGEEANMLDQNINVRHSFKSKEERENWIVEVPGQEFRELLNQGKVYMI